MMSRLRAWFPAVMGASSLALLVLLPVEVLSWVVIGDPSDRTTQWVTDRWTSPAWRAVDWVFLIVALVHGALGIARWLLAGRRPGPVAQVAVGIVLATTTALLVLATYTIFTFELVS